MNPQEELPGLIEQDEEEIKNIQLREVLEFYDCYDLLPYANHLLWLSTVKEALGHIPFALDYDDICNMVVLAEEISKKAAFDSQRMSERSRAMETAVTPKLR